VTPPVRVLRIIARLNVGGPARHVAILDRGLRQCGFDTLLAHGEIGPGEASLEALVHESGLPAHRISGLGRRVSPLSDLRAFAAIVRLVFRFGPDVVHTHTAKAGALGRLAAVLYNISRRRSARCLAVHTFHGHVLEGYFGRVGSWLVRLLERFLAGVTDCVLVLSSRQARDIGERFRVAPPRRIHVVPLGLDLDALLDLPEVVRGEDDPIVFGFVGRFVPIKNLPLLIDAFAAVHGQEPKTRLLLAGDGDLRAEAHARVSGYGLAGVVMFAGWRDRLVDLYREIDVLVLTSRNEGTPVAVIEAMAAALPVVATDVGGVADVLTDGQTGALVPSESLEPLVAAMLRLVRSPEERRQMGTAAREAVRARFSAIRLVTDVAALYRSALAMKRSGHAAVPGAGMGGA